MDKKTFKDLFNEIARKNGFESAFGMWFKEQAESLVVLDLQRSSYSHSYYVNINVYIQGLFGKIIKKNKDLKYGAGKAAIFTRSSNEYGFALDLENNLCETERTEILEKMFSDFILPFTQRTSTKAGIIEMHEKHGYFLSPAVGKELGIKFVATENITKLEATLDSE